MNISIVSLWKYLPVIFLFSLGYDLLGKESSYVTPCFALGVGLLSLFLTWDVIALRAVTLYEKRGDFAEKASKIPGQAYEKGAAALRAAAPHIAHGLDVAIEKAHQGAEKLAKGAVKGTGFAWKHFWLKPSFWSAVIAAMFTGYFFYEGTWKSFHYGLTFLALSAFLLTFHFNALGKAFEVIGKNYVISWLVSSALILALTTSHGWWTGAILSGLSFICSVITAGKWWGNVKNGTGKLVAFLWSFLSGEQGKASALIAWILTGVATTLFLHSMNTDGALNSAVYISASVTILLIFFGIGALVWKGAEKGIKNP
jgi:hypothetical protein